MASPLPVENPTVVWSRFLVAVARLFLFPIREDQTQARAAFSAWREYLFDLLSSEPFLAEFTGAWQNLLESDRPQGAQAMLLELEGFTDYVTRLTGKPIDEEAQYPELDPGPFTLPIDPSQTRQSFGIASTIVDSLRALFDALPFGFKALLKGLSELMSICKDLT